MARLQKKREGRGIFLGETQTGWSELKENNIAVLNLKDGGFLLNGTEGPRLELFFIKEAYLGKVSGKNKFRGFFLCEFETLPTVMLHMPDGCSHTFDDKDSRIAEWKIASREEIEEFVDRLKALAITHPESKDLVQNIIDEFSPKKLLEFFS